MKLFQNTILILFCTAACLVGMAQKQTPPAGAPAKDFKLSEKKIQTYPNGLKTTLVHYGDLPKANISLIVKTGNVHEGPNQVWLADLTGELLHEGTADMNFAALAKAAAMMGGDLNISVGMDQTTIAGSVLSEYAGDFIKLLSKVVMQPAFPASELERLKSNLKRQLVTQKAVPQNQAQEKFYQAVYKNSPYGQFFPTEEMLNSYTVQMVKDFYDANFGAKRSVLYVVGKFDDAQVNDAVKSSLSTWKSGPDVSYPQVAPVATADTLMIDRKTAPQTTVMIGMPVLPPSNKDYISQVVSNSLLGGSFGSRITSNIRENKGYTYSPYSTVINRKGSSVWFEQADITSEHTIDAVNEIEREISRLQTAPPSKDELAGIQNYEAGVFVLRNSSPSGIINQLNFMDLHGLSDSYLSNYVKNVYSVTPEMVMQYTKSNLPYGKMIKVMVGDKDAIQQQINKQKAAPKSF